MVDEEQMTKTGASPPARRPTIKDVASHAGVSFKTVSRVVNGDASVTPRLREAVEASMEALHYRPHRAARALRGNRSYTIVMLAGWQHAAPDDAETEFPDYLGDVLLGCTQACGASGYHVVLEFLTYGDQKHAEGRLRGLLEDLQPDGILLVPPMCDLPWLLDMLDERGVHAVRLMPGTLPDRGTCLGVEDFEASQEMANLLLGNGHRRIAFLSGPPDHLAAAARRDGFLAAMADFPDAEVTLASGNFLLDSGEREALRLLSAFPRPTALFAANDAMAAGALKAAASLGLSVPADLSLAGFDDSFVARLTTPGLTTVRQPTRELAQRAVKILVQSAQQGAQPQTEFSRMACSIVRRESTRAI